LTLGDDADPYAEDGEDSRWMKERSEAMSVAAAEKAVAARQRALREAIAIDRFVIDFRLASFRAFLRATVHSMSALAADVLEFAECDVKTALNAVRPVRHWLKNISAPSSSSHGLIGRRIPRSKREDPVRIELWRAEPYDLRGDAIIQEGALSDYVAVSIFGSSLEVYVHGAGFRLVTRAGTAHLILDSALPATLAAACQGRALDDIVEHPLLRGRGIVVSEIKQSGGGSVVVFRGGESPLKLPWNSDGHRIVTGTA